MDIAYVISAYKLPLQLERLVSTLLDGSRLGERHVLVHLDAKTDDPLYDDVLRRLERRSDVTLLPRHVCHWGDFGHVRSSLKGIEAVLRNGVPFEYLVLLTGQDYPIRSDDDIEQVLADADGSIFISHESMPADGLVPGTQPLGAMERFQCWHFFPRGRHLAFPVYFPNAHVRQRLPWLPPLVKRRFLRGLQPFFGGSYWWLPRDAVDYVHAYVQSRPEYVRYFGRVYIPDELFFHTLLLNSALRDRVVDDDLRYVDWSRPSAGQKTLGIEDIDALEASPKLFARKFDSERDARVLDLVDERLLKRPGSRVAAARVGSPRA